MKASAWAKDYCERGMALTWTLPGRKGPRHRGWQLRENAIVNPDLAERHWTQHPEHGIAVLLAYSNLVSLDVDSEKARQVLTAFGIDLDDLSTTTPGVMGRNIRLLFKAPETELVHRNAIWPIEGQAKDREVLFELRAGPVADMLPPSVHATTGKPYAWQGFGEFAPLPANLLRLWTNWQQTERTIWDLCPWAPARPKPQPRRATPYTGPSVIERFNAEYDLVAILESFGYRQVGRRFIPADSKHAPGLVLRPDGRVYSHHAGDVLADGHTHDAFDVWARLEHGGDVRQAVKVAAGLLGLDRRTA